MTPPPSPQSLTISSDDTAQNRLDDKEDPHRSALKRIFTPDKFDWFMRVYGEPHQSIIVEAFRFVLEQTHKHDLDAPMSKTDLLHQFGMCEQPSGGLVHRFRNLVGQMLRPFGQSQENHLRNIGSLAKVYCEENPDGGAGYSFGALLDRYLFFHLMYFPQDEVGIETCLIGGEGRRYIEGGDHETIQDYHVMRAGEAPDAKVTLHWVREGYLLRHGSEKAYERVTKSLPDLLGHELDPNFHYLCHGTSIEHASLIVRDDPSSLVGAKCTDFVEAFYSTDAFEFAVFSAFLVSGRTSDPAVLVFPVPRAALVAVKNIELDGERWQHVVRQGRRSKAISDPNLKKAFKNAECVIGPISFNASQVDTGKLEARALNFRQWAFKDDDVAKSIFGDVIKKEAVHVVRILRERIEERPPSSADGRQGRRRRSRGRFLRC